MALVKARNGKNSSTVNNLTPLYLPNSVNKFHRIEPGLIGQSVVPNNLNSNLMYISSLVCKVSLMIKAKFIYIGKAM